MNSQMEYPYENEQTQVDERQFNPWQAASNIGGLFGFPGFQQPWNQPGQQPFYPPYQGPGFPSGRPPSLPPGQGGFPPGQQPGFPGFPPGQQPGYTPGRPPSQGGAPTSPPPSFTPQQQTGQIGVQAVDPGAIRGCLNRFTYIWLNNRQQFWYFPIFVGRHSVSGYRWNGFNWVYYGVDLRRIDSFQCY